ncbi:MAG: hypothetical protein JO061_17750, partial [Acidobacteriaceae bacterium]|nr:hypothetical protein [Acidobacteriaceae bacterium]
MPLQTSVLIRSRQIVQVCSHGATLLAVLLGAVCFSNAQSSNAAANPDFSNVDDILNGRRTLATVDDIVIGGLMIKTDDGTKIDPSKMYQLKNFSPAGAGPEVMLRMFQSPTDTLVYTNGQTIYAADPVSQATTSLKLDVPAKEFNGATMAAGDFNGDGLSEVAILSASGLRVIGPVDPKDPSKGIYSGPVWTPTDYRGSNTNISIAIGDFRGNGQREIALTYGNTQGNRCWLDIVTVDPKTLTLQVKSEHLLVLHGPSFNVWASLAAGHFGSTSHDQLAVAVYAFKSTEKFHRVEIRSFEIDSNFQAIQQDGYTTNLPSGGEVLIRTGHFDPISPYDEVAFKYNPNPGNVQLGIVSFNSNLKVRFPQTLFMAAGITCSTGLAVGNFARTEPVPTNPSKTQPSLKLQLAFSSSDCTSKIAAEVYNVDPPQTAGGDFTLTQALGGQLAGQDQYFNLPLVAGDIQGRSFLLGDPVKVVISDTAQPSLIAAMPPMHVDFIAPVGSNQPNILNLSAIPDGFRTVYETNESNSNQSSVTNSTSWSFGAEVGLELSFEVGSVDAGMGLSVSSATRAAQEQRSFNEEEYGTYEKNGFDASVKTGLSDQVWFTESRFNIYLYPVIGQTVCPAAKPNCQAADRLPLTIQFSGPDKIESHKADGNLIPWYQPPWEPGNVLSYPATFEQLQELIPNLEQLSTAQTSRTDTSTSTERATWTKDITQGSTASFDQNYSFDQEFSVSGAYSTLFTTVSGTATLNLSGSEGFSNMFKAVSTVGKSSGIGVEKPGTFLSPTNYNYPFTPYILGEKRPENALDDLPLNTDVQTFGLLRTAFVVDPARNDAGSWWRKAYRGAPDVALNHPSRWQWHQVAVENPLPPNCLNVGFGGTNMDCLDFAPPRPDDIWDSNFHVMRGFFISSASSPGQGPQLTTAIAGDKLTLAARVYNYSFTPMPPGSQVHVRFYVQPLDRHTKQPVGKSVLINNNDIEIGPIPPFSDDDNAPLNWVLASTTFDTTPYEDQYLTFWVVVWTQNHGELVAETPGHGLKSIPGGLASIGDVPIEDYSNNVGFYNSEFYVFPNHPDLETAALKGEPGSMNIGKIELSARRILVGQDVDVSAMLSAESNSVMGVTSLFYDGDPHSGGTVFGLDRAP